MKKLLTLLSLAVILVGCDKFGTWRDLNENWIEQNKAVLGQTAGCIDYGITHTGLQYEILHQGYGKTPKSTSQILVKYTLWLFDGTQVEHRDDGVFTLSATIPAWQEMLSKMQAGSHVIIYAPYDICYGSEGRKSLEQFHIPPYSALKFEIELIDVWQQSPTTN
jgi:FKBP-type peptidyl-prolyl cis-trans isomerases 1